MSLLSRFVNGSLVSSERLMRAREFYAPVPPATDTARAFAYWTERASVQSELACAREASRTPSCKRSRVSSFTARTDRHQAGSALRTLSASSCWESAYWGLAVRRWPTSPAEKGWQCSS
jgi:hypothetical protein